MREAKAGGARDDGLDRRLAGAAAASQNSPRYLPAALLFGIGHYIAFVITQLVPCCSWLHRVSREPDLILSDGFTPIWGSTVSLLNLILLLMMLCELARLCWMHRVAVRSSFETAGYKHVDASVNEVYLFPRLCHAICVAPVRHNAALFISFVGVLSSTVAICVVALRAREYIANVVQSTRNTLQAPSNLARGPLSSRPVGIDYYGPGYCAGENMLQFHVAEVSEAPNLADCCQQVADLFLSAGVSDGYYLLSCSADYSSAYAYVDLPAIDDADELPQLCSLSEVSSANTYLMELSAFAPAEEDDDSDDSFWSYAFDQLLDYYTQKLTNETRAALDALNDIEAASNAVFDSIATAASVTLFALLISFWVSYELLLRDHNQICLRSWSAVTLASDDKDTRSLYVPPPLVETTGLFAGEVDADMLLSAPLLSDDETSMAPAIEAAADDKAVPQIVHTPPPSKVELSPAGAPRTLFSTGRLADGTLDIAGNFQYLNAGGYPIQVLMAVGFAYVGMLLSFSVLVFLFRYPRTRSRFLWILLAQPILKITARLVQRFCLGLCVVRNNWIRAPRTLALLDVINAFANPFLIATGVSSAISRFILGVICLFFRMVIFQLQLLPSTLSAFDSGTGAYGAVMKCRYVHLLDTTTASSSLQRDAMLEPGALSGGLAV